MSSLIIKELDDDIELQLKKRAAEHNRSMETEVKAILADLFKKEAKKNLTKQELQKTLDDFCALGLHDDLPVESVEDALRFIRKGRRRLWDDI